MSRPRRPRTTAEAATPGSFDGETVTRRAFMTRTAQVAGAVATSAIVLPAIAFAVGPAVQREPATWHGIGPLEDVPGDDYATHVITQTPGVGVAGETTIFVRRRHPAIDTEPGDRFNQVIAITSRCAHVGCPVNY